MTDHKQSSLRSNDLHTKRKILSAYLSSSSPRIILVVLAALGVSRIAIGRWGFGDLVVATVTFAIVGLFEWVVHLFLLHAPDESFRTKTLKTGVGHRQHHLDPHDMQFLLLSGADAAVFLVGFGAFTALWSMPLLMVLGANVIPGFMSAYALAALALAHYEWVHLLVHTRYRPRTRYYAGLTRNHRLHHYRNEKYWLGVTSNSGDRLLRTLPQHKTDVRLSPTARDLTKRALRSVDAD